MCTVCEKGHFLPFLAHCTHFCQNIFFFFKFTLIKSTQNNNLRFFPKEFTHIFKNIILDCKVFKLKRFSSVTRNVSVKHAI